MDAGTLEQVMTHIHNWFVKDRVRVRHCQIRDGALPASVSIPEGIWYRIEGSYLNDGLHLHPETDLADETFDGTISLLAPPRAFLSVVEDIAEYEGMRSEAREKALGTPYKSESFDGYAYTMRDDLTADSGSQGVTGWQAEFRSRLNTWRKVS